MGRSLPWLFAIFFTACGGDPAPMMAPVMTPPPDASVDRPPVVEPLPAVRLVVDSDRNGVLDDSRAEWQHRAEWNTTVGAMLMANVDDDDGNHRVDAIDETVNGEADEADLARFRVAPWPQAPEGASGTLSLDDTSVSRVRIFRRGTDGWVVFNTGEARITREELVAGVEFGIEAKDFPSPQWDGRVTLTLAVTAGDTERRDEAVMKTAPWVMYNSLDPTVRVWGPSAESFGPANFFQADLEDYTTTDGMPLTLVNTQDPAYLTNPEMGPDVWMQDIMEFGWTGIPAPDGIHAMPVVLRTPNTQRDVARYTERELLGPDFGYVWKHASAAINGRAWDVSLDSFGDLELLPPHRMTPGRYPLGRILHGSVTARHSDVALRQFLEAQAVQGPPLYVDTSWLLVGHVDEFVSFIPADTPRGWKLLFASPRLAREVLQRFVDTHATGASAVMFAGMHWYYESGPMRGRAYNAARSVGDILHDADLMAANQTVQGHLDMLREQLQMELGLEDSEIVEVPFLWASHENQRFAAYQPGTINLLFYGNTAIMARPHGPISGDHDLMEDDMTERLAPYGITARFAEQWDLLHAADGEVHCGTNAVRELPHHHWWEVER